MWPLLFQTCFTYVHCEVCWLLWTSTHLCKSQGQTFLNAFAEVAEAYVDVPGHKLQHWRTSSTYCITTEGPCRLKNNKKLLFFYLCGCDIYDLVLSSWETLTGNDGQTFVERWWQIWLCTQLDLMLPETKTLVGGPQPWKQHYTIQTNQSRLFIHSGLH